MSQKGAASDTSQGPFDMKQFCIKMQESMDELVWKVQFIVQDCGELRRLVSSLQPVPNYQPPVKKPVWTECKELTEITGMMVKWYIERDNWESVRKCLLEVLPKTSLVYWQVYDTEHHSNTMHYIGECGYTELATLLLDGGMPVDKTDAGKFTMLDGAVTGGRVELVKVLIDNGANIHDKNNSGYTPLILACLSNQVEVVKLLVRNYADIKCCTNDGNTSLHVAASRGYLNIVEYLVQSCADTTVKNKDNNTPLDLAIKNQHARVKDYLSSRNASYYTSYSQGFRY